MFSQFTCSNTRAHTRTHTHTRVLKCFLSGFDHQCENPEDNKMKCSLLFKQQTLYYTSTLKTLTHSLTSLSLSLKQTRTHTQRKKEREIERERERVQILYFLVTLNVRKLVSDLALENWWRHANVNLV